MYLCLCMSKRMPAGKIRDESHESGVPSEMTLILGDLSLPWFIASRRQRSMDDCYSTVPWCNAPRTAFTWGSLWLEPVFNWSKSSDNGWVGGFGAGQSAQDDLIDFAKRNSAAVSLSARGRAWSAGSMSRRPWPSRTSGWECCSAAKFIAIGAIVTLAEKCWCWNDLLGIQRYSEQATCAASGDSLNLFQWCDPAGNACSKLLLEYGPWSWCFRCVPWHACCKVSSF